MKPSFLKDIVLQGAVHRYGVRLLCVALFALFSLCFSAHHVQANKALGVEASDLRAPAPIHQPIIDRNHAAKIAGRLQKGARTAQEQEDSSDTPDLYTVYHLQDLYQKYGREYTCSVVLTHLSVFDLCAHPRAPPYIL